ncbi:pantoate--beta-alanine ligase [Bauldia sp.]|uniref:pantoate--beta-alanine ligase n=1 Tax=Bauldia sp. TaxID=2575872 RepID=UPI003BAD23F3
MTSVPIDTTIAEARRRTTEWRKAGLTTGFVATMGALHQGHLALIEKAKAHADQVVVSIFVNPTQFAPNEDFAAYPRDSDRDLNMLAEAGVDSAFMPTVAEMYPEGAATTVSVSGPALGLETDHRPHFFQGVATIVAKLFLATGADLTVFGEKDYQQLQVVRRMVADLAIPIDVLGCPTVREPDGLALSSRNQYLSPEERAVAPGLYDALRTAATAIATGADVAATLAATRRHLGVEHDVDYLALRNADTLAEVTDVRSEPLRLLVAAWLGTTRLIDNVPVDNPPGHVSG